MADWHGTKRVWVIHSWPWYWLVWPWWGGRMYRIVIGVTSDVGVPSTYLVYIIARMRYTDPTESAFKNVNVIKSLDINTYLVAHSVFEYHHNELPVIYSVYFRGIDNVHEHNTRQRFGLYAVSMKTDVGLTFIATGVLLYATIFWKVCIQILLRFHLKRFLNNA